MLLITEANSPASAKEVFIAERRRGMRVRQDRPVKVFEPTSARYFAGQTHDISPTGLRIALPQAAPLRPGTTLSVHVGLNRSGESLVHRRQMIPVRVVWIDRDPAAPGRLIAGVEFLAGIAVQLDAA